MTVSKNFPGLNRFNLTTPEKVTIKTLDLPEYSSQFYKSTDTRLDFIIPTKGPTIEHTANSTFPRCELRETLEDGTLAWWDAAAQESNWIEYTVSVGDAAHEGKVIIGQIHGKGDNPLMKVQYNDEDHTGLGDIVVQSREYLAGAEIKTVVKEGVKPGDRVKVRIELTGSFRLLVTLDDVVVVDRQINRQSYKDDRFYFKIGGYVQTVVNSFESTGLVSLFWLDLYHGAKVVVTQPRTITDLSQEVTAVLVSYQAGTLSKVDAEAKLDAVKAEADADFPVSDERKALYTQITGVRNVIREVPVEPTPTEYQLIDVELDQIKAEYQAGTVELAAAKTRLTAASARIKKLADAADRLALNTKAADVKAILV